MKRIYINGRFLSQDVTGVQRYALELLKLFDSFIENGTIDKDKFQIIVVSPHKTVQKLELKHIKVIAFGFFSGHLWEQFMLPFKVGSSQLVNLCNSAPIFNLIFSRSITVVHDVGFYFLPNTYSKNFVRWYKFLTPFIFKFSYRVITVSETEKKRLINFFKKPNMRIEAIQNGGIGVQMKARLSKILPIEEREKYFLYVGSLNAKKNFPGVLKAFNLFCGQNSDFRLKIVGATNTVFGKFDVSIDEKNKSRIEFLGRVDDIVLFNAYNHASGFIFPSFYESSPFPPIEAMEMGCPVILSNIDSHYERAGHAALFCNPNDSGDICGKMLELANSVVLREKLQKSGFERTKTFNWESCAIKTWGVIVNN